MSNRNFPPTSFAALFAAVAVLSLGMSGCNPNNNDNKNDNTKQDGVSVHSNEPLPKPGEPRYQQMVSTFYAGVIAMQSGVNTGADAIALDRIETATKLVPQEPAAWVNLGLMRMRGKKDEKSPPASEAFEKALSLAPNDSRIELIYGFYQGHNNNIAEALKHLKHAVELDPNNVKARFTLLDILKQQAAPDAEILQQTVELVKAQPDNFAARIELACNASKAGDAAQFRDAVTSLQERQGVLTEDAKRYLDDLKKFAASADARPAVSSARYLQNTCKQVGLWKQDYAKLKMDTDRPLDRFIALASPTSLPAAPDEGLTFTEQPIGGTSAGHWTIARHVTLTPELPQGIADGFKSSQAPVVAATEGPTFLLLADGRAVKFLSPEGKETATLPFPGGAAATPPTPDGVLVADFNYDFKPDLALAGAGGLRLYNQTAEGKFTDVTAKSGLPASVTNTPYYGAWAFDIESDGDLDIILAPLKGAPFALRNNGDGTWKVVQPFSGVTDARACVWADLDGDGDADIAMLDAQGRPFVFENERGGHFRAWELPKDLGKFRAITAAEVNRDSTLDLVALRADGAILRISRNVSDTGWETAELAHWSDAPKDGSARLFVADLDNNGGLDLIGASKSEAKIWLADSQANFKPLATALTAQVLSVAQTSNEGRLDLLGVSKTGLPVRLINTGTKNYGWEDLRPRAVFVAPPRPNQPALGDDRINAFGIGGELEIRAGLLYQKQPITGSQLHFGLGEYTQLDAIKIIWPNGYPRSDFPEEKNNRMKAGQIVVAQYFPGGSCPWLFCWNGKEMKLVTDCIWRSPLGLKINAQDTAGVSQTEDWIKIRGDQLVPRDGYYDLRICAELWETHFFDHLALMVVDHPVGTDIFVDERFSIPPPPLTVYATTPPRPVARAVDDNGTDVTEIIRERDEKYLDTFGRGQYQGVTRDHYVEVELPEDAPKSGPLYLVATGWIHPTDSSINVAIGQGHHAPPQGLSLEVPDGKGGWVVAKPGLGFPEGKIKTVLLDLTNVFLPGTPRKARLRTNLEIYWDSIGWAAGLPNTPLKKQTFLPNVADLHFRGFSEAHQADQSSPVMPDYDHLATTCQRWLDLEGYYTRYGDVLPLLEKTDDRYVIMNAGDELSLRFQAPPPPPDGWTRDYVLIGDGWVKDGNFNTTFSKTVLPLPSHAQHEYNTPPGKLKDDPVYRQHAQDWQTYHTRYVSPYAFHNAMLPSP